jgi:hypothetical protein
MRIGDEIGERETVVRDNEVDALGGGGRGRENIGRAGQTRREIAVHAGVAVPEAARRIPKAVIPFAPAPWKGAELITAGAQVPRLCDQLGIRDDRILRDRLEQRRVRIEAGRATSDSGR